MNYLSLDLKKIAKNWTDSFHEMKIKIMELDVFHFELHCFTLVLQQEDDCRSENKIFF